MAPVAPQRPDRARTAGVVLIGAFLGDGGRRCSDPGQRSGGSNVAPDPSQWTDGTRIAGVVVVVAGYVAIARRNGGRRPGERRAVVGQRHVFGKVGEVLSPWDGHLTQ